MELYPEDLGPAQQDALLRLRLPKGAGLPDTITPVHRIGLLGKWWTRGLNLSPQAAHTIIATLRDGGTAGLSVGFAAVFEAAATIGSGLLGVHGHAPVALALETAGTGLAAFYLMLPRIQVQSAIGKPLTPAEIDALRADVSEEWARNYLQLAREAIERQAAPETARMMRDALRALGAAIEQIPTGLVDADPHAFRAEAALAMDAAQSESDPVVAASRERRAETLTRAAETAARFQSLTRRATALREEVATQIEALRLCLTGLRTDTGEATGLILLADAVRNIAAEADALTTARAELDAALPFAPHPLPTPGTYESTVQARLQ